MRRIAILPVLWVASMLSLLAQGGEPGTVRQVPAIGEPGEAGGPGNPPATEPVQLQLPAGQVRGIMQPADPAQTGVLARIGGDKPREVRLPIVADTSLWKESRSSAGNGKGLLLRDNRFSQGLIKVDTRPLDASADFHATFHFKVRGVERKGQPAAFTLHRILTEWSEDATWYKPSADRDAAWDGLKPGVDYEAKPLASWKTEALNDGQVVDVDGLDEAVKAWRDGTWPNHGFLLLLNGKAMQCSLPSREAALETRSLVLGGDGGGEIIVEPNLDLFRHVLPSADDLADVSIQLKALKPPKASGAGTLTLQVFRTLRPITDGSIQPGTDIDPLPIAALTLTAPVPTGSAVVIPGLADALRRMLSGEWKEAGLLIRAFGGKPGAASLLVANASDGPTFDVVVRPYPHARLFDQGVTPQAGVYAELKDGHLSYGGRRLRLWGVVGYPTADRLVKMGFNAQRVWNPDPKFSKTAPGFYSEASIKRGEPVTCVKGDGSKLDEWDKHFADLKSRGLFVMFAALQNGMPVEPLADDDSFVAPAHDASFDASDWGQWKKAVLTPKANFAKMVFVDDRLQAIRRRAAKNLLEHVNPYTGNAYGREENIAVYEVFNENGFTRTVLEGGFDTWPPYFQAKLTGKWNQWLKSHYAGDADLLASWKKTDDGESLARGTVRLGPTLTTRAAYSDARAADFVHFTIDLTDAFHQDFRAYCRTLAPAGVGVNVAPFSFDTQYRPCLPWNYTNSRAEVNCFGMYFWDLKSSLAKPPSAYVIDANTTEGSASILYETNNSRPDPFRAEYPLKLAALAGWQDWDGVFWHYWGTGDSDESYLVTPLRYPALTHYWTAVYQENDPVMCAAMAMGGRMFLDRDIDPAPKPTVADVGARALFGYENYNGIDVGRQTFARGARIHFDPSKPAGVSFDPPPPAAPQRLTGAVAAGDQILWDWPNGRLIIDTPNAIAYVGKFTDPFKFGDGIVLGDVNTPFVSFAMTSADGRPLTGPDASRRIHVAAVADARNTGFQFDWGVQGGPVEQSKAVIDKGHPPVIVDKVTYALWFPTILEGRFGAYDFALRPTVDQPISGTNKVSQPGPTPFMSILTIDRRGAPAATPEIAAVPVVTQPADGPPPSTGRAATPAVGSTLWNPIPSIDWQMDYPIAHKSLSNSKLAFSSISSLGSPTQPQATITLSDARLPELWDAAADVEITFTGDRMRSVEVTFKQPPPFAKAAADLEKKLGPATAKQQGAQFEQSFAKWENADNGLAVSATESQGVLKILVGRK